VIKQILYRDIFLLPIMAGIICQVIKLIIYSVMEKKFIPGGLFKPDGMPNVHASVFAALSTVIGIKYGFSSLLCSVSGAYSIVILHDTMRIKRAREKQVNVLNRIISSIEGYGELGANRIERVLQYRPLDVLAGMILGITLSYIML
jgi:acid phosphatase family membrane protein YuiD